MGLFRKYLKQFTTNKINIYCIEIHIIYACGQSLVKDWLCICVNMVWSWMKLGENNLWHNCTANTRTSYQMTPVSSVQNMKWNQNTNVFCFEALVWYKSVHMFMQNFVHTFIWFGRGRGGGVLLLLYSSGGDILWLIITNWANRGWFFFYILVDVYL